MANIQLTHAPILASTAQLLVLPVNNNGIILDSVITRCKTLYPDNYARYRRLCRDGALDIGSCLVHKRRQEQAGLSASTNRSRPSHIANLVVSGHPYHPLHQRKLAQALSDLHAQLIPLIRYQGLRRVAVLIHPLVRHLQHSNLDHQDASASLPRSAQMTHDPLDWHSQLLPLLIRHLTPLPKLQIDLHLPKTMTLSPLSN